ncbi:MAG: thioredoxin domain-containing protein [Acetobacter sp.]|nr:thioredoxin domain-containing protein [Acetobacter sp.]
MNKILNVTLVVLLAALGAGAVVYADRSCPQKQVDLQKQINTTVAQYIDSNTSNILEKIAKTENFGNVIKSFSMVSDEEMNHKIKNYLDSHPAVLEEYIRDNASFVAATVLDTEEFRNAVKTSTNNEQTEEENNNSEENLKFLNRWDEMRNSEVAPFVGPQDAKVAVVEFFDFACGHCKALAPIMGQLTKDNPDVKFVFMPLSFIGEHSGYAAKASMAAAQKGKYMAVSEGVMTLPEMNEETINQILVDEGLDVDEIKTLMEEKEIRRGLQDIDALSRVLDINGVPMVLINGEPFYGRSLEDLQNKINSYK